MNDWFCWPPVIWIIDCLNYFLFCLSECFGLTVNNFFFVFPVYEIAITLSDYIELSYFISVICSFWAFLDSLFLSVRVFKDFPGRSSRLFVARFDFVILLSLVLCFRVFPFSLFLKRISFLSCCCRLS